ncbi:MAG TPA: hypothetical protein VJN89_21770 [Candidatus Acidoferrum sp.]|nr:hypothetical protein [Candidatus Acidoferrum sp.]
MMRATVLATSLMLAALPGAAKQAEQCKCVYPWPPECNKVCSVGNKLIGTWKLDDAKSDFIPGAPKNSTVTYEAAGDKLKIVIDGTDNQGKPIHNEWTGKFDGKDYPVMGDPSSDARSLEIVDNHTVAFTAKKGNKITTMGRIVVAADGKTRKVVSSVVDASGKKVSATAVYDKMG